MEPEIRIVLDAATASRIRALAEYFRKGVAASDPELHAVADLLAEDPGPHREEQRRHEQLLRASLHFFLDHIETRLVTRWQAQSSQSAKRWSGSMVELDRLLFPT